MRLGKINWTFHSNLPIHSIDLQPNSYRFITGGSDHKVCVWNLLPIISDKYEEQNNRKSKSSSEVEEQKLQNDNQVNFERNQKQVEDKVMEDDQDDPFEEDVRLMESLFENPQMRDNRLLAVLDHDGPVNCVRWNNVGTLFASAGDDMQIIIWEYQGEEKMTNMQKNLKMEREKGDDRDQEESKSMGDQSKQSERSFERWKAVKILKGHQGSVSDLAWSPDNIHLASCGTDAQICIWNVNITQPIKTLDAKANGLAFDPFGKFLASQSSEGKDLIIWRVQDFKNITQERKHESYYKQSQTNSLFRRLSWSSDGQYISSTAGRIGSQFLAPLIERSTWNLQAALSGHNKPITVSKINPRLFKNKSASDSDESLENLSCYSVVAIASIESTISIWKPHMTKPYAVILDIFKMGITDMSWGFNGNVLMVSSNDGNIMFIHFKPESLGTPITEDEKQAILQKRYGTTILNDYKQHKRLKDTSKKYAQMNVHQNGDQMMQQKVEVKNGKKVIKPIVDHVYNTNQQLDPMENPFTNQQLQDHHFEKIQSNQNMPLKSKEKIQPQSHKIRSSNNVEMITQPKMLTPQKLPTIYQTFGTAQQPIPQQSEEQKIQSKLIQQEEIKTSVNAKNIRGDTDQQNLMIIDPKENNEEVMGGRATQSMPKQSNTNQTLAVVEGRGASVQDGSAKKKTKPMKGKRIGDPTPDQVKEFTQKQQDLINQQSSKPGVQANPSSALNQINQPQPQQQSLNQGFNQRDAQIQLERMFDNSKETLVMSIEDYTLLVSLHEKEEIQLLLPSRDIYTSDIRVKISNVVINQFTQKANIVFMNSDNVTFSKAALDKTVILTTGNSSFFVLYTSDGQLNIYSSRNLKQIKGGLLVEGICMIESNEETLTMAVVSLKGIITLYKVKTPDEIVPDQCSIEWQTNTFIDILKTRTSYAKQVDPQAKPIYIRSLKIAKDGTVIITCTDHSRYEYDLKMKAWRQSKSSNDLAGDNQEDNAGMRIQKPEDQNQISSIIRLLEEQKPLMPGGEQDQEDEQINTNIHKDVEMKDEEDQSAQMIKKANETYESLQVYEKLGQRQEFLYSLRLYAWLLMQQADFYRFTQLLIDYKFIESKEDEAPSNDMNRQSLISSNAYNSLMKMIQSKNPGESDKQVPSKLRNNYDQSICGMDKDFVFKDTILPVLESICQSQGKDIGVFIKHIVESMYRGGNGENNSAVGDDAKASRQQNQRQSQSVPQQQQYNNQAFLDLQMAAQQAANQQMQQFQMNPPFLQTYQTGDFQQPSYMMQLITDFQQQQQLPTFNSRFPN